MARKIAAVDARAQFDVLLSQVAQEDETVFITCHGEPQAVILSVAAYARLKGDQRATDWRKLVTEARDRIRADLAGRELISADEIIRRMRAERDGQLLSRD